MSKLENQILRMCRFKHGHIKYTQKITSQERFTGQYNVELRLLT